MYVPRTQHRALAVTELVEHEQRVIARAPKVTVVRRSLLSSMYRTLRTVHGPRSPAGGAVCVIARSTHLAFTRPNPSTLPSWVSTSVSNRLIVLVLAAGLSGPPRRPNDYPHRRIVGQPFSVVGILVAGQTTVHRLPEKAHQSVLHVTTAPALLQTLTRRLRQSQGIIQLATGQQSGVRGDGSAAKRQPYTSVETGACRGGWCFHPLGASEDSTLSTARVVAHDQSSTHDNHSALLFGYIGYRRC